MKQLVIFMLALTITGTSFAQDVFSKYEDNAKVTSFVATAKMFKLIRGIEFDTKDKEAQAYKDLVDNIDNIRVFIAEDDSDLTADMNSTVKKYLESNKQLEELMRVNNEGKKVRFYSQDGESEGFVKELLMHASGNLEGRNLSVIMSLTGDLNLNQISKLAKDLKLPGSEELKNIDKKN